MPNTKDEKILKEDESGEIKKIAQKQLGPLEIKFLRSQEELLAM